jgi:ATP-dependent Clp protease ATP-binding subunit ClpA
VAISAEAVNWRAENGYHALLGARPLGRLIQSNIKDVLAEEALFGKLKKGGAVKIGLADGKLVFEY